MLIKIPKKVVNDYIDIQIQSNSLYHWVVDECGSMQDWLWSKGLNTKIEKAVITVFYKKLNKNNLNFLVYEDKCEACCSVIWDNE